MSDIQVQPQNIQAETSVLGAILMDKDAIVKVAEVLDTSFFYDDRHASLYEVMRDLYEDRKPIDVVTVSDILKKKKLLKKIGGVSYLTDLVNETPSASNVESYAGLVKETFVRRRLIQVSSEISSLGYKEGEKLEEILDLAEQKLFGLSEQSIRGDFVSIRKALEDSFDMLDELYRNKGQLRGVPSGFKLLDKKLNGFRKSNLIIIAARPSIGKSALMSNIAQYAAVEKNIPVGIFSLEMSTDELATRMVSAQADIDSFKIASGQLTDEELAKYGEASGILADAPIYIDDTPGLSIMELRTKARRLKMDKGIEIIMVDYLQLMRGRTFDNRVQEVTEISWGLKALAKELAIPVVALAQLSRAVEQRGTRVPQLSDLRESGSIEQDADVVMFLYREDDENRRDVTLSIAKQRNGPTGSVPLYFIGERTRFYEQMKNTDSNSS